MSQAMLHMKYFVLKPHGKDKFAEASRRAMLKYSTYLMKEAENAEDMTFAREIYDWANNEDMEANEDKYRAMYRHPVTGRFD